MPKEHTFLVEVRVSLLAPSGTRTQFSHIETVRVLQGAHYLYKYESALCEAVGRAERAVVQSAIDAADA